MIAQLKEACQDLVAKFFYLLLSSLKEGQRSNLESDLLVSFVRGSWREPSSKNRFINGPISFVSDLPQRFFLSYTTKDNVGESPVNVGQI